MNAPAGLDSSLDERIIHPDIFSSLRPQHTGSRITGKPIYRLEAYPGVNGEYRLNTMSDAERNGTLSLETPIIEYQVNGSTYPIWTVADIFSTTFRLRGKSSEHLTGKFGEEIARRRMKRFLQTFSKDGYIGGLFKKTIKDKIIAANDRYIMKIHQYPCVVMLEKQPVGEGVDQFKCIAEIDTLFDYRRKEGDGETQHIIYLESKTGGVDINTKHLINDIFTPMRSLKPKANLETVIYARADRIMNGDGILRRKFSDIYEELASRQIGVMIAPFHETRQDFRRMQEHAMREYYWLKDHRVVMKGIHAFMENEVIVYDDNHMKIIHLVRGKNGQWHQHRNGKTLGLEQS